MSAASMNAALADFAATFAGMCSRQSQRGLERDFEGVQIAIVDADDLGAGGDGGVQFARVVHFHERGHADSAPPLRGSRAFRAR